MLVQYFLWKKSMFNFRSMYWSWALILGFDLDKHRISLSLLMSEWIRTHWYSHSYGRDHASNPGILQSLRKPDLKEWELGSDRSEALGLCLSRDCQSASAICGHLRNENIWHKDRSRTSRRMSKILREQKSRTIADIRCKSKHRLGRHGQHR